MTGIEPAFSAWEAITAVPLWTLADRSGWSRARRRQRWAPVDRLGRADVLDGCWMDARAGVRHTVDTGPANRISAVADGRATVVTIATRRSPTTVSARFDAAASSGNPGALIRCAGGGRDDADPYPWASMVMRGPMAGRVDSLRGCNLVEEDARDQNHPAQR